MSISRPIFVQPTVIIEWTAPIPCQRKGGRRLPQVGSLAPKAQTLAQQCE
ncbi:hypothetical protein HRE53_13045 [Acaryochloris sp. 'Moss Beach']|nr:hypothetical protein [Acaryochloris sp. 'Moss Beach']UJB71797.1 hypothetical protein HRE53_13045 [Acaryochloris sp. 'Moss Beach']